MIYACTGTTEGRPVNLLGLISFSDINNEALFGPFDSYSAFLAVKYGGYGNYEDPATSVDTYVVTLTGTNAAASSAHFTLRIPVEIVTRGPIGALASVNNTAALTLNMTVNSSANLYSTAAGLLGHYVLLDSGLVPAERRHQQPAARHRARLPDP